MRQLIGSLLAGSLAVIGGTLVPVVVPAGASTAPAAGSADWSVLQQDALQATAAYRGDGALHATGTAGTVVDSSVATPSGSVSVAQRTLVATDNSGSVVLQLVLLGGAQELVTEASPTAGYQGATLVLAPGSSSVAASYPQPGVASPAATTAWHPRARRTVTTDAVVRSLQEPSRPGSAHLDVTGGCYPAPQNPIVVTTVFGPLVQGEGAIVCYATETLSLIVSIYRGFLTRVGNTSGGTSYANYFAYSTYDACSHISGTHDFRTAEIWGVNGVDEGGSTSDESALHCT
jgi:hypothetical protein